MDKLKAAFPRVMTALLFFLFIYTASSKIFTFHEFKTELGKSPLLTAVAWPVALVIPALEIILAFLLLPRATRLLGLYCSLFLLSLFTAYIVVILHFSYYIPCTCGGIISNMTWTQHFYFNLGSILCTVAAILLHKQEPEAYLL